VIAYKKDIVARSGMVNLQAKSTLALRLGSSLCNAGTQGVLSAFICNLLRLRHRGKHKFWLPQAWCHQGFASVERTKTINNDTWAILRYHHAAILIPLLPKQEPLYYCLFQLF